MKHRHHYYCGLEGSHPHGGHHYNEEDECLYEFTKDLSLPQGTRLIGDVVSALQEKGEVSLSGHAVKLEENATYSIWHENTWDEAQKLTIEIEWYPESSEDLDDNELSMPEVA